MRSPLKEVRVRWPKNKPWIGFSGDGKGSDRGKCVMCGCPAMDGQVACRDCYEFSIESVKPYAKNSGATDNYEIAENQPDSKQAHADDLEMAWNYVPEVTTIHGITE